MKTTVLLVAACATAFTTLAQPFEFHVTLDQALTGSGSSAVGYDLNQNFFESEGWPPITLDPNADTLRLPVGWGDSNAGSDLLSTFEESWLYRVVNSSPELLYRVDTAPGAFSDQGSDGTFRDASYDKTVTLAPIGSYSVAQQEADLQSGLWFLRIDSVNSPNGEIAGQLTAVPEPAHYALMAGFGLLGFGVYRRFKAAPAS